jgi:hypothetical protein
MSAAWPEMPTFGDEGYDRSEWLVETDPIELMREHRQLLAERLSFQVRDGIWREEAWNTITNLAADHRHCDCTGSYPCAVRQLVDAFGREFCSDPKKVQS